nr:olfactory receptor 70 [Gregopimpla kuwanae]
MDFYYSMGDFYKFAYALTNVMTLLMVLFKVTIFSLKRDKIIELIKYSKENFWDVEYDEFGTEVLEDCERQCVLFVFTFTVFAQGTVCSYTITPIIDNIGKNETDRNLIFDIWVDLPVTETPYFECLFFIETLSLYHVGILYFCFDNLLCILNVHVNGQFRILSHRLETSCDVRKEEKIYSDEKLCIDERHEDRIPDSSASLKNFKTCIRQHQALISFVDKMEGVYSLVILGQVIVFSALICLVAYQAFLVGGPFLRRVIFVVHCAGTFTQLFMFTLTCHNLWDGSSDVADAAYRSDWHLLENDSDSNSLRKDLILMIMRVKRPCCLTACGFFLISLETFMTINSTAVSYLTLLRQGAAM